jgi:hypothetical protein
MTKTTRQSHENFHSLFAQNNNTVKIKRNKIRMTYGSRSFVRSLVWDVHNWLFYMPMDAYWNDVACRNKKEKKEKRTFLDCFQNTRITSYWKKEHSFPIRFSIFFFYSQEKSSHDKKNNCKSHRRFCINKNVLHSIFKINSISALSGTSHDQEPDRDNEIWLSYIKDCY